MIVPIALGIVAFLGIGMLLIILLCKVAQDP